MSKSTHLLWIAEAEARSVQDFTLMQHASSEPRVAIVSAAGAPRQSNRWRRLFAHLVLAARCKPMAETDSDLPQPAVSGSAPEHARRPPQFVYVETSFDAQRT